MSSEESTLGKLVREADLNRRALVSKIQDHLTTATGRPYRALSYMSRFDVPAGNILPQDAVMFREAINQLGNPENLALVIHSPGGVIEATEKIGLLLREHVKQLLIIIPDAEECGNDAGLNGKRDLHVRSKRAWPYRSPDKPRP